MFEWVIFIDVDNISWFLYTITSRAYSTMAQCKSGGYPEQTLNYVELTILEHSRGHHTVYLARCKQVRAHNPAPWGRFRSSRWRTWRSRWDRRTWGGDQSARTHRLVPSQGSWNRWRSLKLEDIEQTLVIRQSEEIIIFKNIDKKFGTILFF